MKVTPLSIIDCSGATFSCGMGGTLTGVSGLSTAGSANAIVGMIRIINVNMMHRKHTKCPKCVLLDISSVLFDSFHLNY